MTNITNINIRELSNLPSPEFYQKKYPSSEQQTSLIKESRKTMKHASLIIRTLILQVA